ncbi:LysR family transcriptional regulator [Variovorax sp. ZT4R33]|uniref:LysR family transcriptional regulator n=1 Tax=Variovorax sp. ZT4R33 TaxID=3443743 RepID=UPI003F483130
MANLDLLTLRLFKAACDAGNIGRASTKHHTVPSAISKRIAKLEQKLGLKLLERGRAGVQPTPAGEALLEHARAILVHEDRALTSMAQFQGGMRGKVRLLATVSTIAEHLPLDIATFMAAPDHAGLQVDIEEVLSIDLAEAIRIGTASLGICWDATDLGDLELRPYRQDHLAAVVPAGHPLTRQTACGLADTLRFPHVGLPLRTAGRTLIDREAGRLGQRIEYRAELSTFEAALKFIAAGLGITIAPVEIAEPAGNAWGLRCIPLSDAWATRQFVIAYKRLELLSAPARSLLDHLALAAREPGGG